MGAWAYCARKGCDGQFDRPTLREAMNEEQKCRVCGFERHVDAMERDMVFDALEERVKELEEKNAAGG